MFERARGSAVRASLKGLSRGTSVIRVPTYPSVIFTSTPCPVFFILSISFLQRSAAYEDGQNEAKRQAILK